MYQPKRELRSKVMKEALKAYIISPVAAKYHVCAVRLLWPQRYDITDMWEKRKEADELINRMDKVVTFISCVTAVAPSGAHKKRK